MPMQAPLKTGKESTWNEEERRRVVGFFDLLLKLDRKQNPELYKNNRENKNTSPRCK